ncbi:MAG: LURP-one-related family protein [Promethearchaeota archaeon]
MESKEMFCQNCGEKIANNDQKYCEKCGSELRRPIKEEEGKNSKPKKENTVSKPSQLEGASLFDISRNYYLIKERMWDMGFGDIMDEKGKLIGKMNRVIFSIRRRVELQEVDGTVAATIHSKIISARGAQDLKDPSGNLIARIKRKILTFFRNVFYLEDPSGQRWYTAEGDFMGWSFKIFEVASQKLVAEIEKADRWRDVFLGGVFDFADSYALKILDNETDRRILVGFVLSIDNVLHDTMGMGPGFRPGPIWRGPIRRGGRFPRPF